MAIIIYDQATPHTEKSHTRLTNYRSARTTYIVAHTSVVITMRACTSVPKHNGCFDLPPKICTMPGISVGGSTATDPLPDECGSVACQSACARIAVVAYNDWLHTRTPAKKHACSHRGPLLYTLAISHRSAAALIDFSTSSGCVGAATAAWDVGDGRRQQ